MTCELFLYGITLTIGGAMAWAIGANDVANAMASTVGARILTITQAIYIAAIFEALGALLASGQVANMMRHGIVDVTLFHAHPSLFIAGMLSSLLAAATWLIVATRVGLPVSTTHSIIGAIIGFGIVSVGIGHIHWDNLIYIAISWFITPVAGMVVGALLFIWIRSSIFLSEMPLRSCDFQVPFFSAAVGAIFGYVVLFECIETLDWVIDEQGKWLLLSIVTVLSYICASGYQKMKKSVLTTTEKDIYTEVEKSFSGLAIITSCGMAFSHGANDIANAIGPISAILTTVSTKQVATGGQVLPIWLVCFGASSIVVGLVSYGYKIMQTVGTKITQLTPIRGFCIQFSTSVIVIVASGMGLPVSTTQTMVGAVFGVGMVRGMQAVNTRTISNIFLSWVVTLPAGALLSMLYYFLFTWGSRYYENICCW